MKIKYFPCPCCKGKGIVETGEYIDGQQVSPDIECGYCEGKGLIEIDGKRHIEIKRENIALKAIEYFKPEKELWSYEELIELGKKINTLLF